MNSRLNWLVQSNFALPFPISLTDSMPFFKGQSLSRHVHRFISDKIKGDLFWMSAIYEFTEFYASQTDENFYLKGAGVFLLIHIPLW